MEITELVEKNSTLLRLGLHLEFNDARHRVAAHLQRNIDRSEFYENFKLFYTIIQSIKNQFSTFFIKTKLSSEFLQTYFKIT
jgi:hypothetical protein